jgi:glycosyltransferase involved in cell wall biosynthesis
VPQTVFKLLTATVRGELMNLIRSLRDQAVRNAVCLKWVTRDLLRKHGVRWSSYGNLCVYLLQKYVAGRKSVDPLFAAHRYYTTPFVSQVVSREMPLIADHLERSVDRADLGSMSRVAGRTIVLKNPGLVQGRIEKGVLLITFTETFPFFYRFIDCECLLKYFYIVLEPSWAGYCDPNILFWMKYRSHPIIVQATEITDFEFLQMLNSNLIPVSFGASDWGDFRTFKPIPGTKKIFDAIYVTNYHPIKRHHVFFRTIRAMRDSTYQAALVFGQNGDAKAEIGQLIDHFGIRDNVTTYEGVSQQQLNEILSTSKVNVLLSLKEGSNRSIFEAFFADVPGIVLRNNIGVNKSYINDMTGRLVNEGELMQVLLEFRVDWEKYRPREWALQNISPLVTTEKLGHVLRKCAEERGEPWSRRIVEKVNAPEVQYFNPEDRGSMLSSQVVLDCFRKGRVAIKGNECTLERLLLTSA